MNDFKKIFRLFVRNLPQNKMFTVLNGIGLALGLTLCLMVVFYIKYELSFDRQYADSGRTYRINIHGYVGTDSLRTATTPIPIQNILSELHSDIQRHTQIIKESVRLVKYEDKSFAEHHLIYADSSFFNVFNVPFLSGNPRKALSDTLSVVVSEQTALRYFGYENPMGKTLELDNGLKLTVTGVCEDIGANTHMQFDLVASKDALLKLMPNSIKTSKWKTNWLHFNSYCYVVLSPGADPESVAQRLTFLARPKMDAQLKETSAKGGETSKMAAFQFQLQDIRDIHLDGSWEGELSPSGEKQQVDIAIWLAIIILIVTIFNFVNLTTSHLQIKMHEMRVRILAGASRAKLFRQLMGESFVNTIIAFILSLGLLELTFPFFNRFFELGIRLGQIRNIADMLIALSVALLVGGITGLLPAIFFTKNCAYHEEQATRQYRSSFSLRALLVALQVSGAIAMVIVAIGMWHQINRTKIADLGFNPNNLLVVERSNALGDSLDMLKNKLLASNEIEAVSFTSFVPGEQMPALAFKPSDDSTTLLLWNVAFVDGDFAHTIQMPIRKGQFYQSSDTAVMVVNYSIKEDVGMGSDLKAKFQTLNINDIPYKVAGVAGDCYFNGLKNPVLPTVFIHRQNQYKYMVIRFKSGNYAQAKSHIHDVWQQNTNNQPFESFLLTDRVGELYHNDMRLGRLVLTMSLFALFMAALSVVGVTVFMVCITRKELIIRKQQGASPHHLTLLGLLRLSPYVFGGVLCSLLIARFLLDWWMNPFLVHFPLPALIYFAVISVISIMAFSLMYLQLKKEMEKVEMP
ncbi:MAG: ABC transporter permease [Breznakibacter sp.]